MRNLLSYNQAVTQKNELDRFISQVDNYIATDLKSWVIKEYVVTYSIPKVLRNFINEQPNFIETSLDRRIIIEILNEKTLDELHKIAKRMYKKKINKKSIPND